MRGDAGLYLKKAVASAPAISDKDGVDVLQKMAALISHFLHIDFPEHLTDEEFGAKYQQAEWLLRNPEVRGAVHARLLA